MCRTKTETCIKTLRDSVEDLRGAESLPKPGASFSRARGAFGFNEQPTARRALAGNDVDAVLCSMKLLLDDVTLLGQVRADGVDYGILVQTTTSVAA